VYVLCLDINAVDNNVEQKYLFDQQVIRKLRCAVPFCLWGWERQWIRKAQSCGWWQCFSSMTIDWYIRKWNF